MLYLLPNHATSRKFMRRSWIGQIGTHSMFQPNYSNATILAPFARTSILLQSTPVELVDHPWLVGMLESTSPSISIREPESGAE